MRSTYSISLVMMCYQFTIAAPPKLEIQPEIQANGEYVSFTPNTDAPKVVYIGMSGTEPFPSGILRDERVFFLPVRGLKEARYAFVAIGIKDNEYTRTDFVVIVGKPTPPKPPTPPIPPTPKPKPDPVNPKLDAAPTKTDGLHVVFVYETGQRVTQSQFNVMYGLKVRSWLDANCDMENKTAQYRLIDQNQTPMGEPWATTMKRTRGQLPWVTVMYGKKFVYEGTLSATATEDDFVNLLKKYKTNAVVPELWKKIVSQDCPNGDCLTLPMPRSSNTK